MNKHPRADKIFSVMRGRYGDAWAAKWVAADMTLHEVMTQWETDLSDLTDAQINIGLVVLRDFRFGIPSLSDFRVACRPTPKTIPYEALFHEAVRNIALRRRGKNPTWHPAVFWAAYRVGMNEIMQATYAQIRSHWVSVLDDELRKTEWPPIPVTTDTRYGLPPPCGQTPTPRHVARERMTAIRDALNHKEPKNEA